MTYTELVAALQGFLENTFDTVDVNTCIKQAEQRIYLTIGFAATRKATTLTATISSPYVTCPSDFLSAHSLAVVPASGVYTYLLNKDPSFIREAYPTVAAVGLPKVYGIYGVDQADAKELRFILGPTPDLAYSLALEYYHYPESITTAASGRTWLGDNVDSALLYGALVECYTFLKGEADLIKLYDDKYKEALLLAKRLGDGAEKQDQYRSGFQKTPVR
jgi:hypothetical protein